MSGAPGRRRCLLIVAPYFPPDGGGLESYVAHLAEALIAGHGWRIVVVTSGSFLGRVRCVDEGDLRVYRLPYEVRLSNTRFGFTWRRHLKRIIRRERPALINAHSPVPGLADLVAGLAGRTPFVLTYHAGSMLKGRLAADVLIRLYERVLLRRVATRADWVICSSDFVRDRHLTRFRARSSTVAPGVDCDVFAPGPAEERAGVVFVGSLDSASEHKGLDVLLAAIGTLKERFPAVRLEVVGSGDDEPRYRRLCRSLAITEHVRFRGRLSGQDLVDAYRRSAVLALPTRNDSFPTVLVEAMACGVPVVSTTVGEIPRLVEEGRNGFLVAPDDAAGLAERLGRVLSDAELGRRLGGAGRGKVERSLQWKRQAARTNAIFEALLAGRPGEGRHRLAVVAPYFHPKIGGLERYAYHVARAFDQRDDYEVMVLTSNHGRRRTVVEVVDGLTVVRLPAWFKVSNTPVNGLWPWQLRRVMSANRIDLVNVHTPVPFMAEAAALACGRRPLVVTYHAGSMLKNRPLFDVVVRLYETRFLPLLFRRANALVGYRTREAPFVPLSPSLSARLLDELSAKTFLVPPGVDDGLFVPARAGSRPGAAPSVLFVGRIERSSAWKGIGHLLDAFSSVLEEVPDAELVLVGDGDAVDQHRRHAAELGIPDRVRFRGALRGAALVEAYQEASVVVLPSTTDAEAFGMTVIEAMACKKPVVGSRVGGVPFVIDDGRDGLLVPPADSDALARACVRLLRAPGLAAELGERGFAKVTRDYSWPARIEQYDEIFGQVLDDGRRAGGG
jgi:glycosyltransferase involved in cell wall biosynthesis